MLLTNRSSPLEMRDDEPWTCWGSRDDVYEGVEVSMLNNSTVVEPSACCASSFIGGFETPPRKQSRIPPVCKSAAFSSFSQNQTAGKKRLTQTEAFNNGMLLQYLFCNGGCEEEEDDYEASWTGHQPLTPDTWTTPEFEFEPRLTASEQRLMRRRRRRGLLKSGNNIMAERGQFGPLSPPKKSAARASNENTTLSSISSKTDKSNAEWSVSFPKDLVDPHVTEEWKNMHDKMHGKGLGLPELD